MGFDVENHLFFIIPLLPGESYDQPSCDASMRAGEAR